jgi:hypothetical protein
MSARGVARLSVGQLVAFSAPVWSMALAVAVCAFVGR